MTIDHPSILRAPGPDRGVRWRAGERLEHLFEERVDRLGAEAEHRIAVETDTESVSYAELDRRANRFAHRLRRDGVVPHDRVALLLDRSVDTYVALLGVLKAGAAFVPVDAGFPRDRLAYIVDDASIATIVTVPSLAPLVSGLTDRVIVLDSSAGADTTQTGSARPSSTWARGLDAGLAYVIYTSGTTGHPKGVAVGHPSIVNFLRVVDDCYGLRGDDRMYQGMTLAFDFSFEEFWVAFVAGATVVPAPSDTRLVGDDLADFVARRRITAIACVPTLMASVGAELETVRYLMLSGEACPPDLARRLQRPGRRILNAYGPTETTVTCTWRVLDPDAPVTIGQPLPTYTAVLLDPDEPRLVGPGELGEIGIAGIGLADGYVNRPDLTDATFIADFCDLPDNPSKRIYRTGDLGRIVDGEIEFHGRIDTQVKVRGYRIETTEIESVLLRVPSVAQALVDVVETTPGNRELVAYYTTLPGAPVPTDEAFSTTLRAALPAYMVPAYLERLDAIPMAPSGKADRKALPAPKGPRFVAGAGEHVAARTDIEDTVARCLAAVLGLDTVSVVADVFDDLGAHSLLMARFCTELRARLGGVDVSMRDVYRFRTVADLARHLDSADAGTSAVPAFDRLDRPPDHSPTRAAYIRTGILQLLAYAVAAIASVALTATVFDWAFDTESTLGLYPRAVAASVLLVVVPTLATVALKWLVIGRFRAGAIPLWSMHYFRFWLVTRMLEWSPMRLFATLPAYHLYLRALGASVGPRAVLRLRRVPVCPDLLSIGADAVLAQDSLVVGYRAEGNWLLTGRIDVGARALVGEGSVLDIATSMGDGAELAHASSLTAGQHIPAGERWGGSPARSGAFASAPLPEHRSSLLRRFAYSLGGIVWRLLVVGPAALLIAHALLDWLFAHGLDVLAGDVTTVPQLTLQLVAVVEVATVVYLATIPLGLVILGLVPRVLGLVITPGRVYPLYGFRGALVQAMMRRSNSRWYNLLFGDSVLITSYLRWIGWDLGALVQTGSNFGCVTRQDHPGLTSVGSGTMISDGLIAENVTIGRGTILVEPVRVPGASFLGNAIRMPHDHVLGDDVLLATKVMVPVTGPERTGVGLLGSPAFEIPRLAGAGGNAELSPADRHDRLVFKTKYNLVSMLLLLVVRWSTTVIGAVSGYAALASWHLVGFWAAVPTAAGFVVLELLVLLVVSRSVFAFRSMAARDCTVLDPYFWRVERFWKLNSDQFWRLFPGTPFRSVMTRATGVTVGRMVYDDGCGFTEPTLVRIGDQANLNRQAMIQSHSLENGGFKSDRTVIGDRTSVGPAAFVHYAVTTESGAVVDADAFVMKGELLPAGSIWGGNPAQMSIARVPHEPVIDLRFERSDRVADRVGIGSAGLLAELGLTPDASWDDVRATRDRLLLDADDTRRRRVNLVCAALRLGWPATDRLQTSA